MLVQLSHKVHEIIFETADNVMRWIGFGVTPLGSVKSGEAAVTSSYAGGMQGIGHAAGAAAGSAGRMGRPPAGGKPPGGDKVGQGGQPSRTAQAQGQADVGGRERI